MSMSLHVFNAAGYIRLSREDGDKEESDSVGNQRKLLTEYIDKEDGLCLYGFYIDDGYTGTSFRRPDFQRMMTDIEGGRVNCVIVKDLSRFGRDYIDAGRYLERYFPEKGVRFISISDGIDSIKQSYGMLLPIKNIFNEQYARDISNKIHATVESKQKAGEFIGSFPSYGYKKSPLDKNKLIIDEYPASIIRRIFSLYISGYGKQKIARILNAEGILCPSEYKKAIGLNYHNPNSIGNITYWSYSTINSILHREMYTGNMVQGTKYQQMRSKQKKQDKDKWIIVENTHEPVIDKETWDKAQSLLKKRTRELDLKTNRNIFSGFIKCGNCGSAMSKNMWRLADGTRVDSLYCGTYKRNGRKFCTPHMIPLKILEEIVLKDLKVIIQNTGDLSEIVKEQNFAFPKTQKTNGIELNKWKAELERIRKLKQSVYEDYKEGLISKEEFVSYREDYLTKEMLYIKQINAVQKRTKETDTEDVFQSLWLKRLLELKNIEELDRTVVVEMIHEIQIYEDNRIKITYNFSDELEQLFSNIYQHN